MSDSNRNGDRLFPDDRNAFREFVRETYRTLKAAGLVNLSPDTIAYTCDFEAVFACILGRYPDAGRNQTFRALINVRKRGEAKAS